MEGVRMSAGGSGWATPYTLQQPSGHRPAPAGTRPGTRLSPPLKCNSMHLPLCLWSRTPTEGEATCPTPKHLSCGPGRVERLGQSVGSLLRESVMTAPVSSRAAAGVPRCPRRKLQMPAAVAVFLPETWAPVHPSYTTPASSVPHTCVCGNHTAS